MHARLSSAALRHLMERLMPAIRPGASPILEHVLVEALSREPAAVPMLRWTATCSEFTVVIEEPATVLTPGMATIPAAPLRDLVKGTTAGEVEMEWIGDRVALRMGATTVELASLPAALFPPTPAVTYSGPDLPVAALHTLAEHVPFVAATEASATNFHTVALVQQADVLVAYATDRFRLARVRLATPQGQIPALATQRLLLPRMLAVAQRLAADTAQWTVGLTDSGQRLGFRLGSAQCIGVLPEGEFADCTRVFPDAVETCITLARPALIQELSRTLIVQPPNSSCRTELRLDGTRLVVEARQAERGTVHGEVPVQVDQGHALQMAVNGRFLLDLLQHVPSDRVALVTGGADRPLVVRPAVPRADVDVLYLLMALRATDR